MALLHPLCAYSHVSGQPTMMDIRQTMMNRVRKVTVEAGNSARCALP